MATFDRQLAGELESPFLNSELFAREDSRAVENYSPHSSLGSPFQRAELGERESPSGKTFPLTQWTLATSAIKVASAGSKKKGTLVTVAEAPAVFLSEIIGMARDRALKDGKTALANRLDPKLWFNQFTRIMFLGRPFKKGQYVHREMAQLLKELEGELVTRFGSDAKRVGDLLLNGSNEGISGSRLTSATATFSMHMFGLAVDMNYCGNPFIQSTEDSKALNNVLKNAALLMNQPILVYEKGYAKNKFDSIQQMDAVLETYFSLLDKPDELVRLVQASTSSEWRDLTPNIAKTKIEKNLHNLANLLSRGNNKDHFKRHAILDLDKRFVEAMEHKGLYWGGHYGDMMHFDMRGAGVGYYIEKARLDYSGKAKRMAKKLVADKKYGSHRLESLRTQYDWEVQAELDDTEVELEDENVLSAENEFEDFAEDYLGEADNFYAEHEDAYLSEHSEGKDTYELDEELGIAETYDEEAFDELLGDDEYLEHQVPPRSPLDFLGGKVWTFMATSLPTRVAVFLPRAASSSRDVEVLLYIHGLQIKACGPKTTDPADFITKPKFELGKIVEASKREMMLIVPLMQWGNWDKTMPLGTPCVLNDLVEEACGEVAKVRGSSPSVSSLVVAGHSKAYEILDRLAKNHASPQMSRAALARLAEVWALDSTYTAPKSAYEAWLGKSSRLKIRVHYRSGTKTDKAAMFKELAGKHAGKFIPKPLSKVEHCNVPMTELPQLLGGFSSVQKEFEYDSEEVGEWEEFTEVEAEDELELEDELEVDLELRNLDPVVLDIAEKVFAREEEMLEYQRGSAWTRCFSAADIAKVQKVYEDNSVAGSANGEARCSCIVMLNVALGQLLPLSLKSNRARSQSSRTVDMADLTTESIEQAMAQLRRKGFATAPIKMNFFDGRNRTAGTLKPERLKASVQTTVLKKANVKGCWFAFGLSVMDGYHSVLLLVDHTTDNAKIYWLDQFSNGLADEVTSTLDQRLTEKTQAWWQSVMDTKQKGYNTTIRLWSLRKRKKAD